MRVGGGDDRRREWEQDIIDELNITTTATAATSVAAPPQRVRCHSKELDMDSLDLMDGQRSSMQDIALDQPVTSAQPQPAQQMRRRRSNDGDIGEEPRQQQSQPPSHAPQPLPHQKQHRNDEGDPPLRQTSSDEYHRKPNVTMLPLRLIRPTSKLKNSIISPDLTLSCVHRFSMLNL